MANSFERIYAVVKKIPRGTVASYGQVALLAGNPRWARVGWLCAACQSRSGGDSVLPRGNERRTNVTGVCVRRRGYPRALLEADGIEFTEDGRVDMAKYGWTGLG